MGGASKRQAVSSPQAGELDSIDAMYVPRSETQIADDDMCVVADDEGPTPGPSNRICIDDD